MKTSTVNRASSGAHACGYRGCKKSFPSKQGLSMHIGRKHTKTIPNAWENKARVTKVRVDGSLSNGRTKRKYTKRASSFWNKTPTAPAVPGVNRIGDLSPKQLQRVGKLYIKASKLRRRLEQVLLA